MLIVMRSCIGRFGRNRSHARGFGASFTRGALLAIAAATTATSTSPASTFTALLGFGGRASRRTLDDGRGLSGRRVTFRLPWLGRRLRWRIRPLIAATLAAALAALLTTLLAALIPCLTVAPRRLPGWS